MILKCKLEGVQSYKLARLKISTGREVRAGSGVSEQSCKVGTSGSKISYWAVIVGQLAPERRVEKIVRWNISTLPFQLYLMQLIKNLECTLVCTSAW
jgi:hypothetical protein